MSLVLLGVDFRRAALDVRAALSYDASAVRALLTQRPHLAGVREAAVLSTCNRTEFYLVVDDDAAAARWLQHLRHDRAHARVSDPACLLVRHEGEAAATHLFEVAAGLSSALLGDTHVAGQVKQAYAVGCEMGSIGPVLHRTFQVALRVARRTRRETALGRGHVSIGACVSHLASIAAPDARTAAVIGTGTVATDVARHLAKGQRLALTIVSRDPARAAALAGHVGGRAALLPQLEHWWPDADIVIGATTTVDPVITADAVARFAASGATEDRRRLICDLGVPRTVAPDVDGRLFTIDDIQARRDTALAAREAAVPAARRLVAHAVDEWRIWRRERVLVPTIVDLYAREDARHRAMAARLVTESGVSRLRVQGRLRRTGRQLLHTRITAMRASAAAIPETRGGPTAGQAGVQG